MDNTKICIEIRLKDFEAIFPWIVFCVGVASPVNESSESLSDDNSVEKKSVENNEKGGKGKLLKFCQKQ